MTLPYERTLAVIKTREFLENLSLDSTLEEALRRQADRLLRHYPSEREVLRVGKLEHILYGLPEGATLPMGTVVSAPVFGDRLDRD